MFVDSSAVVAILTSEDEKPHFEILLQQADRTLMSPLGIYEATLAVARKLDCRPEIAEQAIKRFIAETEAQVVAIDQLAGAEAIAAFVRYGKGRHKAALNMGDCFSYALARLHNVPLLCKGDDFRHTDIQIA